MDNINSFLVDWSIRFLENKDVIRKEIVNIEKDKNNFTIHYKDKLGRFFVEPVLRDDIFKIKNEDYIVFITLNNMANIKFVVSNWTKLIKFKFLSIYFINPCSSSDKVWIIRPYIHDRICDKASLELGLRAMAEMVDIMNVEELSRKIKLLGKESGL